MEAGELEQGAFKDVMFSTADWWLCGWLCWQSSKFLYVDTAAGICKEYQKIITAVIFQTATPSVVNN